MYVVHYLVLVPVAVVVLLQTSAGVAKQREVGGYYETVPPEMQRPRRNACQIVILCLSGCGPGLFLQLIKSDCEAILLNLHSSHADVRSIIYVPSSFSALMKYLKWEKSMSGYNNYQALLGLKLKNYLLDRDGLSMEELDEMFPTEESVQVLCLKFILDDYVRYTSRAFITR